jgi:small GTP-binding protein
MTDSDSRVVKVVFVGDAGVGKTCIINTAVRRTFIGDSHPTVGTGFEKLAIGAPPNRTVFEIWDTAGQERYRSLTPRFFKQARAAVFVFDLTSHDSLGPLSFYLNGIRQVCPEGSVTISLVGNKTDLEDEREITLEEAIEVQKHLGARFYRECSAKNGAGVVDIFKDLANCQDLTTNERWSSIDIGQTAPEKKKCPC